MWAFLERLLDSWTESDLIWFRATFDAIIAVAYFSIPVALSSLVSRRRDIDFGWIFWVFAFFITACGLAHLLSIVALWVPIEGIGDIVRTLTAGRPGWGARMTVRVF